MISENEFVNLVQQNELIIFKVISLYSDTEEDKQDLYQETLMQLWKSMDNFNGKCSFSTWMYKVALNVSLTFRRKSQGVKYASLEELSYIKAESENKEDYEILYLIIKLLPENDRMIITLHLDGYSNEEISDIAGISRNHTNVKIFRIKETITNLYNKIKDGHQ